MLLFSLLLFTAMFILCSVLLHFRQLLCVLFYILFCFVFVYIIYVCYFSRNLYSTILFIFPLLDYHSFCYFFFVHAATWVSFFIAVSISSFWFESDKQWEQKWKDNETTEKNSMTLAIRRICLQNSFRSACIYLLFVICVCVCVHIWFMRILNLAFICNFA